MYIIGSAQLVDEEGDIDDTFTKRTTRQFYLYTSTDATLAYVRNNVGVGIYSTDSTDPFMVVKRIKVKRTVNKQAGYPGDNPGNAASPPPPGTHCYQWLATVEWGPWDPLTHTPTGNPVDMPIQVSVESQKYEGILDIDAAGNPVLNTAYVPFDPPATRDMTRFLIRVVRNEPSFSTYAAAGYADQVNLYPIDSFPAKTLKCAAVRGNPKWSQFMGVTYYEVEYIFETSVTPVGWKKKILNQSLIELNPLDATKRRPISVNGLPLPSPGLLDASGHYLPPPVSSSNIIYLTFDAYTGIDYAGSFGFPAGTFA